jgi:hypothetical protein
MTELSVGMLTLVAVLTLAAGTLGGVVGLGSTVILFPICNFPPERHPRRSPVIAPDR